MQKFEVVVFDSKLKVVETVSGLSKSSAKETQRKLILKYPAPEYSVEINPE